MGLVICGVAMTTILDFIDTKCLQVIQTATASLWAWERHTLTLHILISINPFS